MRDKCYLNNTKCRKFLYEDLKDRIGVTNELITKDCVYDERLLRNAIRKFQLDNNLKCDGMPGRKTLAALGYSEEEITFIVEHIDTIVNLQLLEGIPNTEKNNKYFDDWVLKRYNSNEELDYYLNRNLLNKVYKKNEFIQMYTDRKEELRKRLLQNLSF